MASGRTCWAQYLWGIHESEARHTAWAQLGSPLGHHRIRRGRQSLLEGRYRKPCRREWLVRQTYITMSIGRNNATNRHSASESNRKARTRHCSWLQWPSAHPPLGCIGRIRTHGYGQCPGPSPPPLHRSQVRRTFVAWYGKCNVDFGNVDRNYREGGSLKRIEKEKVGRTASSTGPNSSNFWRRVASSVCQARPLDPSKSAFRICTGRPFRE